MSATDMTSAPEIALLAVPVQTSPTLSRPTQSRPTIAVLARELREIAGDLDRGAAVGINHVRYEQIKAWMMTLVPGEPGFYCDCEVMLVISGEVAEESVADGGSVTTALRPGRIRVHGQGQVHQLHASGSSQAVTLHVRGSA